MSGVEEDKEEDDGDDDDENDGRRRRNRAHWRALDVTLRTAAAVLRYLSRRIKRIILKKIEMNNNNLVARWRYVFQGPSDDE